MGVEWGGVSGGELRLCVDVCATLGQLEGRLVEAGDVRVGDVGSLKTAVQRREKWWCRGLG